MKEQIINVVSDREKKIAGILQQLEFFNRYTAIILVYMWIKKNATSKDIKLATGLSQPEVSNGTKKLIAQKLLSKRCLPRKEGRRGRSRYLYILNKSTSSTEKFLIKIMQGEIKGYNKKLELLKTLISKERKVF